MTISPLSLAATSAVGSTTSNDAQAAKLKSAAQQFEAVFLRQMIGAMRQASLGDGMFDNQATGQFQDMADSRTADAMSKQGVFGIAEMLSNQLGKVLPQAKVAGAGIEAAGRAAHVVGDLASRIKL